MIAALIAAGELEKRYTTRPRRGMSRNRYQIKTLRVSGTTLGNKPPGCTKPRRCHPGADESARPIKTLLRSEAQPARPMSPRNPPYGDTRRNCVVPRSPFEILEHLFPVVRDVPAARRSAISVTKRIPSDSWPEFRAKAEQLARIAHRYRSAWAVWYRWARNELDGTRRWHETGLERRSLEDRAGELRLRNPSKGAEWLAGMKAELLKNWGKPEEVRT